MRLVRWIGIALAVPILALVVVAIVARFSDGPLDPYPFAVLPGGPLRAGELVTGPEPDWSFARDIVLLELQLVDPARSRHTWLLVHEGKLYVPCGYMNSRWGRLWKRWPIDAMNDGRAVIRIAGKRYEREAIRVTEPALFWSLIREVVRKYRPPEEEALPDELPPPESTGVWFFELAPRSSAGTRTESSPRS
jgi:hypothetical protein